MNKDEKSLLDELWQAAGMGEPPKKEPAAPEIKEEAPVAAPAPVQEQPAKESSEKEEPIEEKKPSAKEVRAAKKQEKAQAKQAEKENKLAEKQRKREEKEKEDAAKSAEETKEKKKNIKFLVLYTVIFVIVISGLIGGSYLVSSRIHKEMSQSNDNLSSNESTLKNIQIQNKELKEKNAALESKNALLTQQTKDTEALLDSVGDMVEHDQYLAAAQNAYINQKTDTAKSIFRSIERSKLSEPNKSYYDTLKEKLGL